MGTLMYGWAVHGIKPLEEPAVVEEVVQPKPGTTPARISTVHTDTVTD